MSVDPQEIYRNIEEWPKRPAGSEDEMLAREALMIHLDSVPDIHISEEAVLLPSFPKSYSFFTYLGLGVCVWLSNLMPEIALLCAFILLVCYSFFRLGYHLPLLDMMRGRIGANLVASKGTGSRLFLIMAHLDTENEALLPFKSVKISASSLSLIQYGMIAVSIGCPLAASLGYTVKTYEMMCVTICVIVGFLLLQLGYARFGQLGNDAASVTTAFGLAAKLWADPIHDTEVRLVVMTGKGAGGLGAQRYVRQHDDELLSGFRYKEVYALSFENVGQGKLAFVQHSGLGGIHAFKGRMIETASTVTKGNAAFKSIEKVDYELGFLDSQPFMRRGIPSVAIVGDTDKASVEETGENIVQAIKLGEAILRTV